MRTVSLSPSGSGAQPVVIYDENKRPLPDWCKEGFRPASARLFRNTNVIRAAAPFMADRFNPYVKWDFTVVHTFATYAACQDFIGGRAAIIRAGELTILQKTNQATFTRYYKTAFLTLCDPIEENGQTCLFRYTLLLPSLYSLIP